MNRRRYPWSMFIMGVLLNLLKLWPCPAAVLFLCLLRVFIQAIPPQLPSAILSAWPFIAVWRQLKIRKSVLTRSQKDAVQELFGGHKNKREIPSREIEARR